MPTLRDVKEAILGSDETHEYHYQCSICQNQFTDTERTVESVACPSCGAHRVRERSAESG